MELNKTGTLNIGHDINLSWADGMIGALPVFDSEDAAIEYADGAQIIEIQERDDVGGDEK